MTDESANATRAALPRTVDRAAFESDVDGLRAREKAHTREGDRVFETYWTTTLRGVEEMDYSYALMDLTVHGRQEAWEDSPAGWPQERSHVRTEAGPPDWPPVSAWPGGRPIAQWPRLEAGRSDDLANQGRSR